MSTEAAITTSTEAAPASTVYLSNTVRVSSFHGVEIITKKNSGGWSGSYSPNTSRPFAVFVDGVLQRDGKGAVRTFATRDAARGAGELVAAEKFLTEKGATRETREDSQGKTRAGWWLDGVWLAPVKDVTGAIAAINGN